MLLVHFTAMCYPKRLKDSFNLSYFSSRGDWNIEIAYTMDFTMDKEYFKMYETREAKHNGEVVFSRDHTNKVKRNGH